MNGQQDKQPLASVEANLFAVLFAFHKKTMTLLRESSLDEEKLKVVSDRLKIVLEEVTADMKATQQANVAERLDAAYEEAKRLVEELSHSDDGDSDKKAKPKTRRLKGRKNKP